MNPQKYCCLECGNINCETAENCRDSASMGTWCAVKANKPVDGTYVRQPYCFGVCQEYKPKTA